MIIQEPLEQPDTSTLLSGQDSIQEHGCEVIVEFKTGDPVMVTNHAEHEGAKGIYVYYYSYLEHPHYVMLEDICPGKFLWLDYEQLIKLDQGK